MDRKEEFKRKLAALMREYQVTFEVTEDSRNYSTVPTGVDFDFKSYTDEDGDWVWPGTFHVGTHVDADDVEAAK